MFNLHFDPVQAFVHEPSKTVIMLCPKVMTQFLRRFIGAGSAAHCSNANLAKGPVRGFPRASARQCVSLLLNPNAYSTFAFVRNPYDRLQSVWQDKFFDGRHASLGLGEAGYSATIRRFALPAVRRFARKNDLAGGTAGDLVPFDTFVRHVAATPSGRRNRHWEMQTRIIQHGHFRFERLFKVETELEIGAQAIFGRIGFDHDWILENIDRRVNVSGRTRGSDYTPELADIAYGAFAADFEAFGYPRDSWGPKDERGGC